MITPSSSGFHLSVLSPAFEVSRSQCLPFALTEQEFDGVSWVAWQEAEDPYAVLVEHLKTLRNGVGHEGGWRLHLEENVRQFVASGLAEAVEQNEGVEVGLASIEVRQQRMRKTEAELAIQHCVSKVSEHFRIPSTDPAPSKADVLLAVRSLWRRFELFESTSGLE